MMKDNERQDMFGWVNILSILIEYPLQVVMFVMFDVQMVVAHGNRSPDSSGRDTV